MKALILLPFIIAANWVPVSKIESREAAGAQTLESCVQTFRETCLDVGDQPDLVELGAYNVELTVAKANTVKCESIEDCDAKFLAYDYACPGGDWEKIKNYDLLEIYCVKPNTPALKVNEVRLAEIVVERGAKVSQAKARQERRALLKKELKEVDIGKVTTIAALKAVVQKMLEVMDEQN